ncbi:hypothetical protein [Paenibacillus senegalensis]|uniref:hypothetical protein n=1 Tax=Paenibacillus senegalensis TaxID=1465766 RepID=UPI000287F776|nr:hypothetical protein [Paenibacillus senegalensis]
MSGQKQYCSGCGAAVGTRGKCVKCSLPSAHSAQPSAQRILFVVTGGAVSLLAIGLIGGIVNAIINWL